jgi:hypothetical protein
MKSRYLLLLLCLFLIPGTAQSQIFKGGVMLGFNGSQVDGDMQSGYDKLGLMGGAFIYTPLSRNLDLQFEIEYMGKGAQSVQNGDDYNIQFTINLQYIEMPVILRLNTIRNFGLEAGLGFGYLFSQSENLSSALQTNQITFNSFELSGILGFNYHINENYSVVARYSYSLIPVAHVYNDPNYYISGLYNNLFSVGLCYQFP